MAATYAFGASGGRRLDVRDLCASGAALRAIRRLDLGDVGVSLADARRLHPAGGKGAMRCQALILGALTLGGCATTTLRSGEPPGKTGRLRRALAPRLSLWQRCAASIATISRKRARAGWAEIRIEPGPVHDTGGASRLFHLLAVAVTVVCAKQPGDDQLSF